MSRLCLVVLLSLAATASAAQQKKAGKAPPPPPAKAAQPEALAPPPAPEPVKAEVVKAEAPPAPMPAPEPAPVAASAPVVAAIEPTPAPVAARPRFEAGVKAGGIFPQVLGRLSTNFSVALDLAWLTPLVDGKLALAAEVAYSQPSHAETITDPRVPDTSYSYTVTERTLAVFIGPRFFFLPPGGRMVPWVSLGVRAQFIDSKLVGQAGVPFGLHDETGTHLAYGGNAGFGYRLGPGLLGLELQLISAPLDHLVTGQVDIGDLAVRAAYLFTF